jgi:hypothetical protein
MLTGRIVARRADRIRLVSKVVPDGRWSTPRRTAVHPPNSPFGVWMTKEVMWSNLEAGSLQGAIDLENRTQLLSSHTGDMRRRSPRSSAAAELLGPVTARRGIRWDSRQVALVTGSQGIGRAVSLALAEDGADTRQLPPRQAAADTVAEVSSDAGEVSRVGRSWARTRRWCRRPLRLRGRRASS